MIFSKINTRNYHTDNSFSDILTVKFPAQGLRFLDIDQSNRLQKLREIAHFRYFRERKRGEKHPVIVTYARLEQDQPAGAIFPDLDSHTKNGERLLSANSLMTYTLRDAFARGMVRYTNGQWDVLSGVSTREQVIITRLNKANRLHLYTGPDTQPPPKKGFNTDSFDITRNFIPVDRCGTLGDYAARHAPRLAFNTSFFLLEYEDYFSHHSGLGEAFNMWVSDGMMMRPPLYRRGAFFGDAKGHWRTGFFSLEDLSLTLPGGLVLYPDRAVIPKGARPFALNTPGEAAVTLYTRYLGVLGRGVVIGHTPKADDTLELTVVDRRVVGWKTGGGLAIPQNGLVISFAAGAISTAARKQLLTILENEFLITYSFIRSEHADIREGLQTGPLLLKDGRPWLWNRDTEQDEQFWPSRTMPDGSYQMGLVPTDYDRDGLHRRHARAALGIDAKMDLILVMAAGVSKGTGSDEVDSQGVSLIELADLLLEAGVQEAVNLDGGGSTQAYFYGGRALVPGERRGLPQVHFERPIPSIGVFS